MGTTQEQLHQPKFTRGNWKIHPFDSSNKDIFIQGPSVLVDYDDVDHEEQEANAHLIAASPQLYGALEVAILTLKNASHSAYVRGEFIVGEEYLKSVNICEAALKKARGG